MMYDTEAPDMSKIAGGCYAKETLPPIFSHYPDKIDTTGFYQEGDMVYLENCIFPSDCEKIVEFYQRQGEYSPVSIQGRQDIPDDRVGSNRITCWDPNFAKEIWDILRLALTERTFDAKTATDWWQILGDLPLPEKLTYKPIGVSPMVRFMKYQGGGQHYAHYDAGYIYHDLDENYRTLQSGILYLTTNKTGATRFIQDGQINIPIWYRKHDDWTEETPISSVVKRVPPIQGSLLMFDHRICHDVEQYDGAEGDRIIIRFDVIYQQA